VSARKQKRWERCILNRDNEALSFFSDWMGQSGRTVLLIAGAGFDPRATKIPSYLAKLLPGRIRAIFIREERPNPQPELLTRAESNIAELRALIPNSTVHPIEIFSKSDMAVIGGRAAAGLVSTYGIEEISDVLIDCSALSRGIVFPLVRSVLEYARGGHKNVHLAVTDQPIVDEAIVTEPAERATTIHGFKGNLGLEASRNSAVLWLPQLVRGQRTTLTKIYDYLDPKPHDVCPILPFPSADLRRSDKLLQEYRVEIESTWNVDHRNLVFADESNPLDLYRAILRIDDERSRIFEQIGGSVIVLSPVGSKALSFGALMAAIDRDFPVAYVEALNYKVNYALIDRQPQDERLVHLWLQGDAYAYAD
jgi:hypothetical protein